MKESILKDGCREPLVVWKPEGKEDRILIDGYHRHKICIDHNISYKIRELSFKNKEEVKFWMWNNQRGRRNVTTLFQRIEVVLKIKDTVAAEAKERQLAGVKGEKGLCKKFGKNARTNTILGKMVGTSHATVGKVDDILNKYKVSEEEIAQLRSGKMSINRIHSKYKDIDQSTEQGTPPTRLHRKETIAQWKSLTPEVKNDFIRGTFDSIANDMKDDNDKREFANMVIEWANNTIRGEPF